MRSSELVAVLNAKIQPRLVGKTWLEAGLEIEFIDDGDGCGYTSLKGLRALLDQIITEATGDSSEDWHIQWDLDEGRAADRQDALVSKFVVTRAYRRITDLNPYYISGNRLFKEVA